jgi:hypothetical protein
MKLLTAGAAVFLALSGVLAAGTAASAAPLPLTNTPTTACTGLTPSHQIGTEGDSSQGLTVTYGDNHLFSGTTGPGGSYNLQHHQYIANNGTGRTILNAKGIFSDVGDHRSLSGAGIYFRWDNATKQYLLDSTNPNYNPAVDGADTTYPGYSIYALQAGSASPLTYETIASNGVIPDVGEPALVATDAVPTYALGTIAPGGTSTADFMLAVERGSDNSFPTWGFNLHFSGQFQCPVITGTYAAKATIGTAYSSTVSATAEGAVTYSVGTGALPAGLSLDPTTGAITGNPTTSGTFNFAVYATDAWGEYTSTSTALVVPGALASTGVDATRPVIAGASLLAAGLLAIVIAQLIRTRRRRHRL